MLFSAIGRLNLLFGRIAGIIFVIISLLVMIDVAARLLGAAVGGMVESSENLLVLAIALAFAETQRRNGNISVELFVDLMGPRLRRAADILSKLVCLAIVAVITYGLIYAAAKSISINEYQFSTIGAIPIWPTKVALAIGFALLAAEFVIEAIYTITGNRLLDKSEEEINTNV